MTTQKAIKELTALKADIMKDGVIDYDETTKLLDFIKQYVNSKHEIFKEFKNTIDTCRADGKISTSESLRLQIEINNLLCVLRIAMVIEGIVYGIGILGLIAIGIWLVL